jgi:hypothetical protein
MYQDLRAADHRPPTGGAGEPIDAPNERGRGEGFWRGLAEVLLSMPAGVGIRIGG